MSVWVLHLKLTPEEEARIADRAFLPLPFDGLPDLSKISSQGECRQLFAELDPDAPPETIHRKAEKVWKLYSGVQEEDIIAVLLHTSKAAALAEVTGNYRYMPGIHGESGHAVPVKWHDQRVPFSAFKKQQELLQPGAEPMVEVAAAEARVIIRDRLPHSYNRFARWKWLLAIFFILQAIALAFRMTSKM
jgi:predicted Mrr-cat superfamily restriction endonuclease